MNRKLIVIVLALIIALAGGFYLGSTRSDAGSGEHGEHKEAGHGTEKPEVHDPQQEKVAEHGGHDEHGEAGAVTMSAEVQRQNGVAVAPVQKRRLAGSISATGKVEVNADRIAHVSPRISGKIVTVRASLGDGVAAGQTLATLDSVELGEALSRYRLSKTRLALTQSNMERIKALVEKKIVARKDILQAETDYKTAQTELHTDEERLALFGLKTGTQGELPQKPLLPVRSPIGGIITEKHAIVGELADPAKSLYTVADLSSVWVMVDIHEKDLAKVRTGQVAQVMVGAFPELKFKGRLTHIADLVDEASRTVKARIEVGNPGRKLKPEMFATVEVALAADAPPVLVVAEEAVHDLDGKRVIFVAETPTEFIARPVQVGRSAGGMVEILSGLKDGESYASKGGFILKSEAKKVGIVDTHGHGK